MVSKLDTCVHAISNCCHPFLLARNGLLFPKAEQVFNARCSVCIRTRGLDLYYIIFSSDIQFNFLVKLGRKGKTGIEPRTSRFTSLAGERLNRPATFLLGNKKKINESVHTILLQTRIKVRFLVLH